ncbi:Uncharacterised protein [Vibrio cholerae]|nr:Uncharacterised protein [Vibrio cholerae]CSI64875.1 Uncharacterised protein [Vibrio cholerae]
MASKSLANTNSRKYGAKEAGICCNACSIRFLIVIPFHCMESYFR